ncbi:SurA N-terminal domain-containing protein [Pseudomonadota bacterium]
MEKFRRLPNNIFFKLFLGILLFTFIFFGVTDFIFGSGKYNVAKVGDKNISIGKFYGILNKERNFLIKNDPESLNSNYINSKEFKLELLNKEISSMLLNKAAEDLYLIPKDSAIIEFILANPSFTDSKGEFNRKKFDLFLNNLEFTEKEYIEYLRDILIRRVLVFAVANVNMIDDSLAERIYKSRAERRKVDIVTITEKSLDSEIKQPTEEEVRHFYDVNTNLFYRPEYRKISYIEIDPIKIFPDEKLEITEDKIKEEYELRKHEYTKPETRDIYFIKTNSEQEINKVKEELDAGADFIKLAKNTTGLLEENLKIENVTKSNFDYELATQIFGIEDKKYTDVIPRNGEFVIVYIHNIKPSKEMTFKEIKGEIKTHLLALRREELFSDYIVEIEDKLLLANDIHEFSKDLSLRLYQTEKFNSEGLNLEGKEIVEISKIKNFINVALELNNKTFSDLIFENNKYYVLFLEEIEEEGILAYKDFSDEVRKMLIKDRKDKKVKELAENIEKQLRSTENIFMVAIRNNLKLEKDVVIERNNSKYSRDFLNAIFIVDSEDPITNIHKEKQGIYKIAALKQILRINNIAKENIEMVKRDLNEGIYEDLTMEYIEYLRNKIGVSINSQSLQQLD